MATPQENLARFQEIANRGLQDRLDPDKKARFDEAVRRGLIKFPQPKTQQEAALAQAEPFRYDPSKLKPNRLVDKFRSDIVTGTLENLLQFGAGIVSEPAAGLSGLAVAANPLAEEGAPAETVKEVRQALKYEPRTEFAKQRAATAAEFFSPVGEAMKKAEQTTGDIGYEVAGPVGGAIGSAIPAGVMEALGFKGASKLRGAKGISGITDDAAAALERAGVRLDDLSDANIQQIKSRIEADARAKAERMEAFEAEGVQPTRGDIGQNFAQQKRESELFEMSGAEGDQMRKLRLYQSEKLKSNLESMVDDLGVSAEVGASVKDALTGRKQVLKQERRRLYDRLAEEAQSANIPLLKDDIMAAMPDSRTARDIASGAPNAARIVDDALKDYGFIAGGKDVTPFSLSNFESFRKALNRAEQADQTGAIRNITGPLKRAVDETIDTAALALARSGNENIANIAKEARQSHIALKTEFDAAALTDQLIQSKKRNSNVAKFEDSQVYQKLISKSTPVEQFKMVSDSLKQAGNLGTKGLADLKNTMLLDIVDSAFGAGTRKIVGERTFGSAAFKKKIDEARPKLEQIFTKDEMKRIDNMYRIADSIQVPSGAIPKGSAGWFMDTINKLGVTALMAKTPAGSLLLEPMRDLTKKAANKRALQQALDIPKNKEAIKIIYNDFPSLAAVLGISAIRAEQEDQEGAKTKYESLKSLVK